MGNKFPCIYSAVFSEHGLYLPTTSENKTKDLKGISTLEDHLFNHNVFMIS